MYVCSRWPGLNITSQLPSQHILFPLVVHVVVCSPCLALLPVMLMLLQVISFSRAAYTKRGSKEREEKSSEGSDSDYRMLQKYYLVTMFKIFLRPCRGRLWLMRASTCRSHTPTHTHTYLHTIKIHMSREYSHSLVKEDRCLNLISSARILMAI